VFCGSFGFHRLGTQGVAGLMPVGSTNRNSTAHFAGGYIVGSTFWKKVDEILLAVVLLVACVVGVKLYFVLDNTGKAVAHFDVAISQINTTVIGIAKIEDTVTESQRHMQAQTLEALKNAKETLHGLNKTVATLNTDVIPSLNAKAGKVLDTSNQLLADTNKNLTDLTATTAKSLEETQTLVAATTKSVQAANDLLADPVMIGNFRQASVDLKTSMTYLPPIMSDLEAEQHDVRGYVHRLTKPATSAMVAINFTLKQVETIGGAAIGVLSK